MPRRQNVSRTVLNSSGPAGVGMVSPRRPERLSRTACVAQRILAEAGARAAAAVPVAAAARPGVNMPSYSEMLQGLAAGASKTVPAVTILTPGSSLQTSVDANTAYGHLILDGPKSINEMKVVVDEIEDEKRGDFAVDLSLPYDNMTEEEVDGVFYHARVRAEVRSIVNYMAGDRKEDEWAVVQYKRGSKTPRKYGGVARKVTPKKATPKKTGSGRKPAGIPKKSPTPDLRTSGRRQRQPEMSAEPAEPSEQQNKKLSTRRRRQPLAPALTAPAPIAPALLSQPPVEEPVNNKKRKASEQGRRPTPLPAPVPTRQTMFMDSLDAMERKVSEDEERQEMSSGHDSGSAGMGGPSAGVRQNAPMSNPPNYNMGRNQYRQPPAPAFGEQAPAYGNAGYQQMGQAQRQQAPVFNNGQFQQMGSAPRSQVPHSFFNDDSNQGMMGQAPRQQAPVFNNGQSQQMGQGQRPQAAFSGNRGYQGMGQAQMPQAPYSFSNNGGNPGMMGQGPGQAPNHMNTPSTPIGPTAEYRMTGRYMVPVLQTIRTTREFIESLNRGPGPVNQQPPYGAAPLPQMPLPRMPDPQFRMPQQGPQQMWNAPPAAPFPPIPVVQQAPPPAMQRHPRGDHIVSQQAGRQMAPQQYSPVILPPMYRIAQPDQIVPLTPADMRELFLGPVSKTPTPFEIPHKPTPHQRSEIKDTVQPGECTPDLFEERIESENNGDKDSFPYWCSSTLRGIWVKVKTRADRLLWVRLGVVNQTSPEALATMPEQMQRAFSPEGPQDEPVAFRKTSLISKRQKIFIDSDDEEQEAGAKSPNIFDQELDRKKQKNMQEDAKEALALGRESVADPQRQDPMPMERPADNAMTAAENGSPQKRVRPTPNTVYAVEDGLIKDRTEQVRRYKYSLSKMDPKNRAIALRYERELKGKVPAPEAPRSERSGPSEIPPVVSYRRSSSPSSDPSEIPANPKQEALRKIERRLRRERFRDAQIRKLPRSEQWKYLAQKKQDPAAKKVQDWMEAPNQGDDVEMPDASAPQALPARGARREARIRLKKTVESPAKKQVRIKSNEVSLAPTGTSRTKSRESVLPPLPKYPNRHEHVRGDRPCLKDKKNAAAGDESLMDSIEYDEDEDEDEDIPMRDADDEEEPSTKKAANVTTHTTSRRRSGRQRSSVNYEESSDDGTVGKSKLKKRSFDDAGLEDESGEDMFYKNKAQKKAKLALRSKSAKMVERMSAPKSGPSMKTPSSQKKR